MLTFSSFSNSPRAKRKADDRLHLRWTDNTVPFTIGEDFSLRH